MQVTYSAFIPPPTRFEKLTYPGKSSVSTYIYLCRHETSVDRAGARLDWNPLIWVLGCGPTHTASLDCFFLDYIPPNSNSLDNHQYHPQKA